MEIEEVLGREKVERNGGRGNYSWDVLKKKHTQ